MNPVWNQPLTADSSMKVLITWNLKTEKTNSVFFFLVKTVLKYQKKKNPADLFLFTEKKFTQSSKDTSLLLLQSSSGCGLLKQKAVSAS